MTGNDWARVKDLFHAALERSPDDRSAFLAHSCHGDRALITEVERLLSAHAQAGGFIEQSPASLTGRRLGRYEVGRLVGVGGMGEVYAARDTDLGRDVALKIASRAGVESHARLRREAQHASQLNHPNICTVHEVGTESGQPYIVMEYVHGQSVSEIIPAQGLPFATVLRYGIQIADALTHAHQHGVIHRDLKSTNVVVTPEGRPKVLDFGLARRMPQDIQPLSRAETLITSEGVVPGTPAYMAPELLHGEPADTRSDIWALGVLLHEMATGQRPFKGDTAFQLSESILHDPIGPLPERVPPSLQAIVRRCLAKDRRDRYQQAVEVRSALETADSEATSAKVGSRRGSHLIPKIRIAAITAILITAIALAIVFTRRHETTTAPVAVGTSGRRAIAVMNFEIAGGSAREGDAWLAKGVPRMLVTGLAQMRDLDIISGQRLREVGAQSGRDDLDALDRSSAADIAKRAGAGAIVVGSIFKTSSDVRIDAQLEDLSSGRVLVAESVRGTDLFALADQLAAKIRDGIGLNETALRKVSDISSASLDAYKLYSDGVDANQNARWPDADKLLRQAVGLDPEFVQAYLQLSFVNQWSGRPAAAETYLRKAASHADRLTEREQLLVRTELARVEGRSTEAARLLEQLVQRFPDFDLVYPLGMFLYGSLDAPLLNADRFVPMAQAGVNALPRTGAMRSIYAYALMSAGRFDDAGRQLDAYLRLAPREANPYDSLGELQLVMGAYGRAVESYSRALTIDPTFSGSHVGRSWASAALGRYDDAVADHSPLSSSNAFILSRVGRYRDAASELAAGLKSTREDASAWERAHLYLVSAVLAIERRGYARARQDVANAELAIAELVEERRRIYLLAADLLRGIADAREGALGNARLHLDSLKRRVRSDVRHEVVWRKALESEVAIAAKQPSQVLAMYRAEDSIRTNWAWLGSGPWVVAATLPFRDGRARAQQALGDLNGALATYRELLTPGRHPEPMAVFEPRYVLEIGRLLEQTGDKAAARIEYARFLELWRHADAELPELSEARAALARLRGPS